MNNSIFQQTHTKLSEREIQILKLISFEYTSAAIAKELYLSLWTVETHRSNIMSKLGARNAAGMVRKGFESGVLNFVQKAV